MSYHAVNPVADSWCLALDGHPALADVRTWVRQRIDGIVVGDRLDDILLVVVELVTNAEVHTGSPQSLAMRHRHGAVLIEVSDGDPTPPMLQPRSITRSGGRGIYLVDALSTDWGVRRTSAGKAVWSLFAPHSPEHAALTQ